MTTLVFNGWAAGPETWSLATFRRDWTFDYLEQMAGIPERAIADFDETLLVGFSMGSMTALRLLCRHPERVKGLVLVSATPRMMEERIERGGESVRVWDGFTPRRLAAFRIGTEMVYRGNPSPLFLPENLRRGLQFLEDTDLRGELERTARERGEGWRSIPVAIFHSERDGIVRPANADYLKGIFPQAKVTWVPGNEHVLPVKVPELISAAVEKMQNERMVA